MTMPDDCLIIDDPHSTESAESEADREKTIRIFLESVPTRLNSPEKSAIIIIMQRLHEEDVSGTALANDLGYVHLNLPMEYDPSRHCVTYYPSGKVMFEDPRTEDGELLFPDRFPRKVVESYKSTMGPYAYAGQMQQAPVPRGGGIFKWDWWQLWGNEDDPDDPVFKRFPVCEYVVASLDTALTEKTENDYCALTVWGVFRDAVPVINRKDISRIAQHHMNRPKIILMHAWKKRLPLHGPDIEREDWETDAQYRKRSQSHWGVVEWTRDTCNRFRVDRLLIEAKANGHSVAQEIRRLNRDETWGVQLVDPKNMDKVARAYSVQHLFSDGMVYAPDRDWVDMVKAEMANFPKVTHDDITDTATQALRHLRSIGLAQHGHEIDADLHEALMHNPTPSKPLYPV
jgi:predicted phage terminase large subunit-like protein